jgi:UDP-N-acetylmuramoylalanine--D-glutamate ligase
LIYEILKRSVPIYGCPRSTPGKIYLTGNIGKTQPLEILDELKSDDWIIYELSSFQLQDLGQSPHIGVVLMVTSEHLDYHQDEQEYVEAKSSITKFQTPNDFAVINADFKNSVKIGGQGKGQKFYFSRRKKVSPGCYIKDEQIIITGSNFQFPISNLRLKGAHNLENVCAAACVGEILKVDDKIIRNAITGFKGLKHRLEFVAEKNGIKFYNDSFSTTPETAIAAIDAFEEPEIVILGGSPKNSDFAELGKKITAAKNIKTLILIGEEAAKIKLAVDKAGGFYGTTLEGAKNMEEIFAQIKSVAANGDIVLLSPACASFGMFKNYKDRGEQFKIFAKNF